MAKRRKPIIRNKIVMGLKEALEEFQNNREGWQEVKPYPETASFHSRLETATLKYENAIDELIINLKGVS